MLPEGSGSGRLTLYRAAQFPLVWEEERVLVPRPLVDASLVEWQSRWYLLASDLAQPGAAKNGERECRRWGRGGDRASGCLAQLAAQCNEDPSQPT